MPPLYMDIHTVDSDDFSVEDVVKAHMQDLAVEKKFGVNQIKYWVDVDNKKIFCLMEGPNKEACNAVHLESHGNTACNIIEVSDDEYNLFLNHGKSNNDLAHTHTNEVDPGFRTFLLVNTIDVTYNHQQDTNRLYEIVESFQGMNIAHVNSGILISFMNVANAVNCAINIDKLLKAIPDNYEHSIAIVTGDPVDVGGQELFEETKNRINILGEVGCNNSIYLDELTVELLEKEPHAPRIDIVKPKIISTKDFRLLEKINQILNTQLHKPDFNLEKLNDALGLSRAQSYRKIKSITGLAPNQLIQELRLRHSLIELRKKDTTVAEVAYDMGFNSSTYFTRIFKQRFHTLPSQVFNPN